MEAAAIAIAGAGSIAGGLAGDALNKALGKGGGTQVAQADPQIAIDYFKQAAQAQAAGYDTGLYQYGFAINKARTEIQEGYDKGNATLSPMSVASNQALNEQLRFMGMDPIQATAGYGQALRALKSMNVYNQETPFTSDMKKYATNLADMFDNATALRNKDERIAAKQQILQYMDTAAARVNSKYQNPTAPSLGDTTALRNYMSAQLMSGGNNALAAMNTQRQIAATEAANIQKQAQYNKTLASNKAAIAKNNEQLQSFKQFRDQFNREYTDEYDGGYSPEEIANKVTQLPGYQFQVGEGLKALDRNARARGMGSSQNAALAAQEYGQQQAMSYYKQHLGDLQGVVAQGAPFTAKIAENQINLGNALGQLSQLYGAAAMDTERTKADYLAGTLMKSGEVSYDSSKFNANSINTATQKELDRQSQERQQGMLTGGYLGAAQQKFQQQIKTNNSQMGGYLSYGSS